ARRPALEPVVLAAVDLNELAEPWPPLAQQERPPRLARLRLPKAKSDLKPPYALTRDRDPLDLGELFGGQGRAKAGVLAAQKPFDPFTDARPEPPQRNPPTLLGDKPGVALPPIGANQPFHLPNVNPQPLARRALAESLCNHKSNNMRALTFSAAHPQNLVPQTSPLPESAEKGTFSRCTKGTFPCCGNRSFVRDSLGLSRPVGWSLIRETRFEDHDGVAASDRVVDRRRGFGEAGFDSPLANGAGQPGRAGADVVGLPGRPLVLCGGPRFGSIIRRSSVASSGRRPPWCWDCVYWR